MQVKNGLSDFELITVKHPSQGGTTPFNNLRHFYELYPEAIGYEMVNELSRRMRKAKGNNFLAERSDMLDVWRANLVRKETHKDSIRVRVELPESEGSGHRITKVHCADDVKKLGYNYNRFEITLSTSTANSKTWFYLVDFPEIIFRPLGKGQPMSKGAKYWVQLETGNRDDYVDVECLKNAEIDYYAAPREEAAVNRATFDSMGSGRAFSMYQYDMTAMGWQKQITDRFWRAAKYFGLAQKCDDGTMKTVVSLSQMEMDFSNKANNIFDTYLTIGKSLPPRKGTRSSMENNRPFRLGVSWWQFMLASGAQTYSWNNFNILFFINKFKRENNMLNDDMKNVVYYITCGTTAFEEKIYPELLRLDKESNVTDAKYSYLDVPGMDPNRQGVITGRKQLMGAFLPTHGHFRVNISKIFDKGILSGKEKYRNRPISSTWISITAGTMDDEGRMTNFCLYENSEAEQQTYRMGELTPGGLVGNVANAQARFKGSFGDLGLSYLCIEDLEKGLYVDNFNMQKVYFPDKRFQKRSKS